MILIVGLGNPGKEFDKTRHNIGYLVLNEIMEKYDFPPWKNKFSSFFTKKNIFCQNIVLLKPQTFMNLSGNSIEKFVNFFKVKNENIIVFHDDLDMIFTKIRIKKNGGHGGHNGIKHIISKISENFYRIKIGIRSEVMKINAKEFVLKNFNKSEQILIQKLIIKIVDNFELIVNKNFEKFRNILSK